MLVSGILLYLFHDISRPYISYLLPIPPIGVAAYVFVFNLTRKYEGGFPADVSTLLIELGLATIFSALIFFLFSIIIVMLAKFFT